jgi:hypothetical protein
MRRGPWRTLTEECTQLEISDVVRAGVLSADSGSVCYVRWRDADGCEVGFMRFVIVKDAEGIPILRFCNRVRPPVAGRAWILNQNVEITWSKCRFGGGRFWFQCPRADCRRRAAILYLVQGSQEFGCRVCLGLSYRSCRDSDKRLSRLLRLPPQLLNDILVSGTVKQRLLAVRACTLRFRRMQNKAAPAAFMS